MSKSLGNGIDPLEVIDKYGADAQFAISYAHEASPEIHIEAVFEKLYERCV